MTTTNHEEAVLSILGREPGSAGRAIVELVAALTNNHQEILEAVNGHNENVARVQRELAGKASQADVDEINRRLTAAGQLLSGAVAAHDSAAQAVNNGTATAATVQTAQGATRVASQSVADCDRRIDALEDRVSDLEIWRDNTVTPALTQLREDVDNLQREAPRVPLIQQPQPPAREAVIEEHVAPQPVNPPTRAIPTVEQRLAERDVEEVHVHFINRTIDIRHWSGLQWLLAILLGFVVGVIFGKVLADWSGNAIGWWNWLGFVVAALVGFCLGGLIGAAVDNARRRREAEHNDEQDNDHHHDEHHRHREDVVQAR